MIGKMKILAIIFSLVIAGSAATLAMSGGQESDKGCRNAPKTVYVVHLAEVEARYNHEIYLLISSENGEPVCGFVEILPRKFEEREGKEEWEKEEYKEDEEKESKEEYEDDEKEGEKEEDREEGREEDPDEDQEEEQERRREEEEDEEREGEREEEREEEDEECEVECEEEEEECEEEREEDCCRCDEDEKDRDKRYRKKEDHRKRAFRFNFKEGKGRILLFPSSHRSIGSTALITLKTQGEVKIIPFIYVKNTDVVVYPDSKDEEGYYCEIEKIKKGTRYSFEDLMDSPEIECDWDYDDVVLYIGQPQKKENLQKEDVEKDQKNER
jgi:hypothetical protein